MRKLGTQQPPAVSVVVPVRDEATSLPILYARIRQTLEREAITFELIFVDDGSADDSVPELERLAWMDKRIRILRLRRGFGKAAALAVGFTEAAGRSVVTIDADLQDDPAEIPALLEPLSYGYDLVSGWRQHRKDRWTRRLLSRIYNWATRRISGLGLHDFNCGLKSYTIECARELAPACHGELHRYLPVLADARGFRVTEVPVNHEKRVNGRSRYGSVRYLRAFLDLFTVMFLSRHTRRPMHLFGTLGLLLLVPGLGVLTYLLVEKLTGAAIGGRPLLILGALLSIAGLQLLLAGLVAEHLSNSRSELPPYRHVVSVDRREEPTEDRVVRDLVDRGGE